MKTTNALIALVTVTAVFWGNLSFALDVVNMRNGDVYRGEIIQQEFNKYIQIRSNSGDESRLLWADVVSVTKENAAPVINQPDLSQQVNPVAPQRSNNETALVTVLAIGGGFLFGYYVIGPMLSGSSRRVNSPGFAIRF